MDINCWVYRRREWRPGRSDRAVEVPDEGNTESAISSRSDTTTLVRDAVAGLGSAILAAA